MHAIMKLREFQRVIDAQARFAQSSSIDQSQQYIARDRALQVPVRG